MVGNYPQLPKLRKKCNPFRKRTCPPVDYTTQLDQHNHLLADWLNCERGGQVRFL